MGLIFRDLDHDKILISGKPFSETSAQGYPFVGNFTIATKEASRTQYLSLSQRLANLFTICKFSMCQNLWTCSNSIFFALQSSYEAFSNLHVKVENKTWSLPGFAEKLSSELNFVFFHRRCTFHTGDPRAIEHNYVVKKYFWKYFLHLFLFLSSLFIKKIIVILRPNRYASSPVRRRDGGWWPHRMGDIRLAHTTAADWWRGALASRNIMKFINLLVAEHIKILNINYVAIFIDVLIISLFMRTKERDMRPFA